MRRADLERAKKICRAERRMRELVFKNDREKRESKTEEMDHVIKVLNWCEGELFFEDQTLFGG